MELPAAQTLIKMNQESYSKIAGDFSDSRSFPWQEVEGVVKNYVKGGNKILDLGCGNGRLLKSLEKLNDINYTGLDNCNKLLDKIQASENIKVNLICDDVLNLAQFADNEFNIVFMIAAFHHIPSKELRQKVMANLHRILKPSGYLIMTNWNLWQIGAKKSAWQHQKNKLIDHQLPAMSYKDIITLWQNKYPLYYYALTKRELNKLFKNAGFKILENYYVKQSKKSHWWNGYNILTVGRK